MAYINGKEVLFVVDHTNHLRKLAEGATKEIPADALRGATEIAFTAFAGWINITSVELPDTVTRINTNAFHSCTGLTRVVIPASVAIIGQGAFFGCTGLTSVVIPTSVTNISYNAFQNCTNLATLYMQRSTPPTIQRNTFTGCDALIKIIVPAGSSSAYKTSTNWSAYADIITEA